MSVWTALVRPLAASMADCELTHISRDAIDLDRAAEQHRQYCEALVELGCGIEYLPRLADHPDSVFVEDTAQVIPERAIICRPGAASRLGEVPSMRAALEPRRPLLEIQAPGTVDGGDLIIMGRRLFIGRTGRSNDEALVQLRSGLEPLGYAVDAIPVQGCLHLKTAATALSDDCLLVNPDWLADGVGSFGMETVAVDPAEPFAANIVRAGSGLLYSTSYPRTLERLRAHGFDPLCVDSDELAKAEGALTCCSVLLED